MNMYFRALALLVALPLTAQGAVVTLSFDEPGISLGHVITTQYSALGLSFSNTNNVVRNGSNPADFTNTFPSDGQLVHFDLMPVATFIDVAVDADWLEFEFRRPGTPQQNIRLALFNDGVLVHDFGVIGWTGPDWDTFTYAGAFGVFDRISFNASNKFVIDNLSVNTVPVPAGLLLLASALPFAGRWRRRD